MPALTKPSFSLDPTIWGPHYWFFLHTIAMTYPIGEFSKLLEEYPVTPYLDSRDSFIRWMHFIHNKINEKLEKPKISINDFYVNYYEEYKPKNIKMKEYYRWREKIIYILVVLGVTGLTMYLYNK